MQLTYTFADKKKKFTKFTLHMPSWSIITMKIST